MRVSRLLLFGLAFLISACSAKAPPPPPPVDLNEGLKELGEVYKYRAAQGLPQPARLEDLTDNEPVLSNAWQAIKDGTIVVSWRSGYSASSAEVLAYEKDVPANGGKVLLRNGRIKDMTAIEFHSASKAR